MVASILIIAFSLVLFVYWFRFSCRLLLRNQVARSAMVEVEERFHFRRVQELLESGHELPPLQSRLHQDFQVLTYLRQHAASLESGSFEDQLLIWDYRLMQWYYRLTHRSAPEQARNALGEMATVVSVLARKMGAQAGV